MKSVEHIERNTSNNNSFIKLLESLNIEYTPTFFDDLKSNNGLGFFKFDEDPNSVVTNSSYQQTKNIYDFNTKKRNK